MFNNSVKIHSMLWAYAAFLSVAVYQNQYLLVILIVASLLEYDTIIVMHLYPWFFLIVIT